jgi:hypothetical protein
MLCLVLPHLNVESKGQQGSCFAGGQVPGSFAQSIESAINYLAPLCGPAGYLREPSSTLEAPSAAPSYSYSRPPPTISSSVSASASEQPLYLHKRTPTQEQLGAEAAAVTHSFVTPRHTSSGHTASGSLAAPSVGTDPASQSTAVLRSAVPGEGDVGGDRPSSTGGVDGRGTPSRQTQDSSGGGARGQGSRQRRRSFLAVAAANM